MQAMSHQSPCQPTGRLKATLHHLLLMVDKEVPHQTPQSRRRAPSPTAEVENVVNTTAKKAFFLVRLWLALPFLVVLIIILLFTLVFVFLLSGGLNPGGAKAGPRANT